jgi:hypothetical protein
MRSSLYGGLMLVAILTVGLVAASCGGGEDHLTKAEFLKQGNAICVKGNKELSVEGRKVFGGGAPSKAKFEKFVNDTLVPNIQGQIDGLDDLSPPADDEDTVNAIVDSAQQALDKVKADPTIVESQSNDTFAAANKLAKDYGLTECAKG